MAKVTLSNGQVIDCTGASVEQIYDQIAAAKKANPPGDFIKCGGKYIRHDQIVIIGRLDVAPDTDDDDDDDETGWPELKITRSKVSDNGGLFDNDLSFARRLGQPSLSSTGPGAISPSSFYSP